METKIRTELKIRGLSTDEIDYLKAQSEKENAKSFNAFLLSICREKIALGKLNRAENLYVPYLENMSETSSFVLEQSEKQLKQLEEFGKQMETYGDHISRWLEYEGEVESSE